MLAVSAQCHLLLVFTWMFDKSPAALAALVRRFP